MDEIKIRIVPGCPTTVVTETEEDKELVKAALGNTECGCVVRTEEAVEEAVEKMAEEAAAEVAEEVEPTSELAEEEVETLAEAVVEEAREGLKCSIEPDKPWEESVCGVVAKEAGRQAADTVMVRLREEGVIA